MRLVNLLVGLMLLWPTPGCGQDLTPADVRISLDQALPMALKAAAKEFPDLQQYILYSVTPRALKGDGRGLHWQFVWQEKAFPHRKLLRVRVYMGDGSLYTERLEKGEHQKARGIYLTPTTLPEGEGQVVLLRRTAPDSRIRRTRTSAGLLSSIARARR